jgi:hypothetical protein
MDLSTLSSGLLALILLSLPSAFLFFSFFWKDAHWNLEEWNRVRNVVGENGSEDIHELHELFEQISG